jgi:polysaccharide export outer membrane protein
MVAVGKTPAQLSEDIRVVLGRYIQDPLVSVMVDRPQGTFAQQIRIVGATERPAALPYRANMTLLDAMIAVGGLSEFAAGDRARLIRFDRASGRQRQYDLRIASLLRRGDVRANVRLEPGDVIIIPESMF